MWGMEKVQTDEHIPGGAFFIARKIYESNIWLKDPVYLKTWIWIIGQARYEAGKMKGQDCVRGEFITTYQEIIQDVSYSRNREHVAPTLKQMRIILEWFEKAKMIEICPVAEMSFLNGADTKARTRAYTGIKINVSNYNTYQNAENYRGRDKGRPTSLMGQTINNKENKGIKKDPAAISSEIASLISKLFPGKDKLFQEVIQAISSTRKLGRISDSIILAILKRIEKYPIPQIHEGCRVYLSKGYYREGKGEAYLLGIIKNHRPERTEPRQEFKSTGSPALDAYYLKQAQGGNQA